MILGELGVSLDPQALVGGYQWEQRGHLVSSWGPQGPYFLYGSVSASIQSVRGGLVILGSSASLLPFGGLWALSLSLKEWLMPLLLRTLCSGHSRPRVVIVTASGRGTRIHQGVSWEELENEERAQNEPGPFCPPKLEQGSNAPSTRATVLPPRLPGPEEWMPQVSSQPALTQPNPTAPRKGPSVFPLASCCSDTSAAATSVTLGCLVQGYFPEPVTVTWDAGVLNKSTMTFPATLHSTSGLYTTSSQLTVSGEWAKQKFTCSVAHAGSTPINKTLLGEPGDPTTARGPLSVEEGQARWRGYKCYHAAWGPGLGHGAHRLKGQHHAHHLCPQRAP